MPTHILFSRSSPYICLFRVVTFLDFQKYCSTSLEAGNLAQGPEHTMVNAYIPAVSSRKGRWNDTKYAEEMLSKKGNSLKTVITLLLRMTCLQCDV